MLLLSMGGVTLAASTASADHVAAPDIEGVAGFKVPICHATGSDSNPYENGVGEIPKWQISGDTGHGSLHANHPDDIIPAYAAGSFGGHEWDAFAGRNWTTEGQAIFNNGCEADVDDGDDLDVSVSVSPASVCVGNTVRFTVANTGDVTTVYDGRLTGPSGSTIDTFDNVSIAANGTHPVDHTLTAVGSYTLTFWVDGNTGISDSATATAIECPDGQVDVSVLPTSVCVGQQVVFTLKNTGSGSTTYLGEFTAPGGASTSLGPVTLVGGASTTFTYTANTAGSYTVKFWVSGNTGISDTATATARVCPDLPDRPDALVDRDVEVQRSCPRGVEERTITVTTEFIWNGTAWVLGTPSEPVVSDWAKVRNLTLAEREELECDEVLPTEAVDVCPNIDGVQTEVPGGRTLKNGKCVKGEVLGTETASPTPNPPVVAPPVDGPDVIPTAVDAGFGGPTDSGSGSMTAVMAQLMMGAGLLFLIAAGWLQRGRQTRGVHQF